MRWRILPLMMVFVALAHFNRLSISVAGAEKIIPSGSIGEQRMGMVYSTFLLLYTIFMIPGGWFVDRRGPRVAWMVVAFGSALGAALTGFAGLAFPSAVALLSSLLIARAIMGSCNAPLHPTGARLAANWIPPEGVALANGLITGAACLGIALVFPVFGGLIDLFGWPVAFLVTSGATFAAAIAWTLVGADRPPGPAATVVPAADAGAPARGVVSLLQDPSLICLTLSYAAVGYFQYLFFYWAEYYFETALHLSTPTSRLYSSLLVLAMGAGMVSGGWFSDRAVRAFGKRLGLAAVPVLGLLIASGVTVLAARSADATSILILFAVAMAAIGSCEGASWTASVWIGGARGGTAASILNTGGNGVGLLAPVVTPWIQERYGWQAALDLASVVCLVGAVLWVGVRFTDTPSEPQPFGEPVL